MAIAKIDARLLEKIIAEVEASLNEQAIDLIPSGKAKLVAKLYISAQTAGEEPNRLEIDRLVWMAG